MFCIKCGKEIKEGEKFCSECGNEVKATAQSFEQNKTEESTLLKPAKKQNKIKKAVVILLILLVLIIVLFFATSSDNENGSNNIETTVSNKESDDGEYVYFKLPLFFIDDEEYRSWQEEIADGKFNGNAQLTDEFIIIRTKRENAEEMKANIISQTDTRFKELSNDKSLETVRNILYEEDFKKATIIVASNYQNSDDSIVIRKVGNYLSQNRAMLYDDYSAEIEITVKDASGNVFEIFEYSHPEERPIELSAKKLIDAYTTNEIAAKRLYENKYVCVTGTVESIGEDVTGTIYITLSNGDKWSTEFVQCYFSEKYANEIASLVKGDFVTVYGTQTDYLFNVMVEDCVLNSN